MIVPSEVVTVGGPMGFLVGLIILVALGRRRFDQPYSVRSFTPAAWYFFALVLYLVGLSLSYFLLVLALGWWVSPVFVALGLMLVVLRMPPLRWCDVWLRRSLHSLAGFPTTALRFAETLSQTDLLVPEKLSTEVKSVLFRRGYNVDEEWLPAAESMRKLWFKAAVLFHEVRGWGDDKGYRPFVEDTKRDFDGIRESFDELSLKVVRVLDTVDRLGELACELDPERDGPQSGSDTMTLIVSDLLAMLTEDIASFLRNLCLYVTRGVFAVSVTAHGRRRRLRDLGLSVDPSLGSLPWLLASAFIAYVGIFGVFWLPLPAAVGGDVSSPRERFLLILMIATIQVAALATAMLAKDRFGFANEDIRGRTPFGFVLGAGVTTLMIAAPIQFGFEWLMRRGNLNEAWEQFGTTWPWLLTAFAVGSVAAWLIQDSRWSNVPWRAVRPLLDGLIMILGMAAATWAALYLGARSSLGSVWPLVALVGFVGGLVASNRRRPTRRREVGARPSPFGVKPEVSTPVVRKAAP